MRKDELYKFSDETLTSVRSILHDIALNLRMDYLTKRRRQKEVSHHDQGYRLTAARKNVDEELGKVMAAPVIPISSDSLEEIAPEVGAVSIISPTRVLDLVDYSSFFDSDPSEDSLPLTSELPLVSPFLCFDDSEADSESEPAEQRPEKHESFIVYDAMVSRWMDTVASRPSSPPVSSSSDTFAPSSEFPVALATTSDSSSFGSSLGSSSDTSSGSPSDSLIDTSLVHYSGCDAPCQTHSGPSTKVTSSRLVYPPVMTLRYSEAFRCWRSAPLSTPYPPKTSESSLDASSTRSIAPTLADLLPPHKRFRDSYSPEDSREEHMGIGIVDAEAIVDLGIGDRVGAHTKDGIGMEVDVSTNDIRGDEEEFEAEASARGMMKIVVDLLVTDGISEITEFETAQRQLDAGQLMASWERAGLADRIMRLGRENLRVRALLCIERDRVDSLRHHMALSQEEFHQIRRDRDDARRRLRRTMPNTRFGMTPIVIKEMINRRVVKALEAREANRNLKLGNGNDEGGNDNGDGSINRGWNGNGNHNENDRGVVRLIRWFEKMETVFHISNCPKKYQVKYATYTLLNSALTWWNSHKRTIGTGDAFSMSRSELMKLMDEVYCIRNEIQKIKSELWNLTMKNNNLAAYTQRFQELSMLCTKMVLEEEDRVKKFIGGLPDNIQGNVIAAEPTRIQDAIRIANNLIDQKLKGYAMKNA
uniref:Reverse transcriptase domain-containing protein n=1 Tax=Tanacetum cinerariifolium TaxID=118510 RepID=A0A6L2KV65_TANCI|nr:reverse transcriptase domain-containing protein [Tanacetum cinerariifolium]